jgi:predicted AAA-ATPase/PD-(D/E)XK nuclease superfamily protein
MKKQLPIGLSDFKKLRERGYAYVDKTLLVKELLESGVEVALILRPRRFGKTLNLSMLKYFFEKSNEETNKLFEGLKIWELEKYRALQGQFPVIFISFKDIKATTSWEGVFSAFKLLIADTFRQFEYLLEGSVLSSSEKEEFNDIVHKRGDQALFEKSLHSLTRWLHRYHNKRVVLLIDEYDSPAHGAYIGGFHELFIAFLRSWLSAGLKDNTALEKGVITGILRIAKESIFSGLNNITVFTTMSDKFQDKFGLLEEEVKTLLKEYDFPNEWDLVKQWYNGYHFGNQAGIYNPWSIINYIFHNGAFAPYWVNTSDNILIKQLITQGAADLKADIEELLRAGTIEKTIEDGIVFADLKKNPKICWSLLLFSGYLSTIPSPIPGTPAKLCIPNLEVKELYFSMILKWFEETMQQSEYNLLLSSLTSGDIDTFSQLFQQFMKTSMSTYDIAANEPEKVYHAFVLGMLIGLDKKYEVRSNRESGLGRYDVMLIPKNSKDLGIVMEFKKIGEFESSDLETAALSALKQIEEREYDQELKSRGVSRILHLGHAFERKSVLIQSKFVGT